MSIVPGQRNLKVHFAGSEQIDFSMTLESAGVNYFLFTCFPFIAAKIGIKPYPITVRKPDVPKMINKLGKHVIMDSGLFTLMFGAHAGRRDEKFVSRWLDLLCTFVLENELTCTCVEVDCQKILGIPQSWMYREKMKQMLPNNRIINVFHIEDGQSGLDRLIEYSNYIAISVPELRVIFGRGDSHRNAVTRFANYIKNKKPEIDIHLLGCTDLSLLKSLNFCTSSDSTSWRQVNRFGSVRVDKKILKRSELNKNCLEYISNESVIRILNKLNIEATDKRLEYYGFYYTYVKHLLKQYTEAAGDQT